MFTDEEIDRFEEIFPLIRRTVGWSAEEFGEKIGVSRQTINNLENKKYKLTRTPYIAMRYVLDDEIEKHPDETEMLKVILDCFVDHPDKYDKKVKDEIYEKANLLSPAIKTKQSDRKEVSAAWKSILTSLGVITAATISAILIGTWKKK